MKLMLVEGEDEAAGRGWGGGGGGTRSLQGVPPSFTLKHKYKVYLYDKVEL